MITEKKTICPLCGGELQGYDHVSRVVRDKYGETSYIKIPRYKCRSCGRLHRKLPEDILPFKQYTKEIILGVKEGWITPETIGFEDYPCEMTMRRWSARNNRTPL